VGRGTQPLGGVTVRDGVRPLGTQPSGSPATRDGGGEGEGQGLLAGKASDVAEGRGGACGMVGVEN
jgi:hypothetical protein